MTSLHISRMNHHLSAAIREQLDRFDPSKEYSGRLPKITSASGRSYFVKTGRVDEQEQFTGEAESLKAIEAAAPGLAPRLYTHGTFEDGKPYFISEYKDIGSLATSTAHELGKRLATELHRGTSPNGKFGFEVPTFCGPTRFENGWYDTWEECYSAMYGTLISRLREKGRYGRLCEIGDTVMQK
jgi:fructosamine-3-kinase